MLYIPTTERQKEIDRMMDDARRNYERNRQEAADRYQRSADDATCIWEKTVREIQAS